MNSEIPQMNEIYRKEFKCFNCKVLIVLDGIRNKYLGIDEIITEDSELLRIIRSQKDELERILSVLQSEHKRSNVLFKRIEKIKRLIFDVYPNEYLIKELMKIERAY